MAWPKGKPRPPNAGRKKGTPNKKTLEAQLLCEKLGVDPFEFLLLVVKGDEKALGYKKPKIILDALGKAHRVPWITLPNRLAAASEACEYVRPKRKAIEHTGKDGEALFQSLTDVLKSLESQSTAPIISESQE